MSYAHALTRDRRQALAIHGYTMDSETAASLRRANAVLKLLADFTVDLPTTRPMPDMLHDGIEAVRLIVHEALVRGGLTE